MDEEILKILRTHKDRYVSAEEISRKLSVCTATVARHIHKLQDEGYDIQFQPHWGYKLVALPDRITAQEIMWQLDTKIIGRKVLAYDVVDSTNTVAFSLARQGASSGTAVFAEGQRKGKGRLGRKWLSPKSEGIYVSLILRPKITPDEAALITLLAAVSCAETVREVCSLPAQIRWPNDILVNNKKVCGILTEIESQGNKTKFIILGIGFNVNTKGSKLPPEAGSLREEAKIKKKEFSRLELARQLLRHLDKEYLKFEHKGGKDLIRKWRNLSLLSGKRVKVFLSHGTLEGQAQDIDEQGALILRLDNGFKQHLTAGDVVKVR